jgi:drug/metabolite transporter (DMT)-like permease
VKYKLPTPKNNKSEHNWVLVAFLVSNVIWAAAGPVVKLTVEYLPPVEFLFYRFLITCLVILPVVIWELSKTKANLKDLPTLITLGLLGYGSLYFLFEGYRYTTVIDGTIIGVIAPVIVAWAGQYFYKEKISQRYKIGVILAIIGTSIVVVEPALSHTASDINFGERIYGNLLIVIYSVFYALYLVLSKEVMGQNSSKLNKLLAKVGIKKNSHTFSPFMHTAISFFVALGFYSILFFAQILKNPTEVISATQILEINHTALYGLLYMAIISGLTAYSLMNWALKRSTVAYTAVFAYLAPVFTLPFAYYLLGEIPTLPALVGSAIIGTGVVIAETGQKKKS